MKSDIAHRFGRSAKTYEAAAVVQSHAAQLLINMVAPFCQHGQRVLEIGCGTGLLSRHIERLLLPSHLTLNDVSSEMITEAQSKLTCSVSPLLGDAENIPWPQVDVILSASALQWFDHPLSSVDKAADALPTGGLLGIATYGPSTFCELHNGNDVPGLYPSFEQWTTAFTEKGFDIVGSSHHHEQQCFDSRTQLLRMIANTGVGARRGKASVPTTGERLSLTYDLICLAGVKR